MLAFIPPLLPSRAAEPPVGPDSIHEIKHDGFRTMLFVEPGKSRAFTRNGHDWTGRYGPVLDACAALECHSAVIDGEVVVEDENAVSDFDALPWAIKHDPKRLVFFAFDLLHLDGVDWRGRELVERRDKLAGLIAPCFSIRFSEAFEGNGPDFFAAAVKHGLEGIVSKRKTSRYRSGPSRNWLKIKNVVESDFVLLGLERDTEGRAFAHVGSETAKGLTYAGMAFMTFGEKLYGELARKADGLATPACAVKGLRRPQATWLRPELRVKVRHLRNGNGLRHASVRAIV